MLNLLLQVLEDGRLTDGKVGQPWEIHFFFFHLVGFLVVDPGGF